jgi:ribonuclease R
VLEKIRARPDAPLLQTVMLRSMRQAVYSPDNVGHFGLAYEAYAHFTSPIRRYPDLLTHRAIKAVLKGETYDPKAPWDQLGEACSATERRADEATRDVTAWLKCYYMKDRLGEVFSGTISGVTSFGVFVTLDDVYVEGLVHISELGQDYFHYEQDKHRIIGERTRKIFQLADRLHIRVARVDIETSKIDFVLVDVRAIADVKKSPSQEVVTEAVPEIEGEKRAVARPAPAVAGVKKPSPAPQAVVTVSTAQKKVISVSAANPPVTPMAGLIQGAEPNGRFAAKPLGKVKSKLANSGAASGGRGKQKHLREDQQTDQRKKSSAATKPPKQAKKPHGKQDAKQNTKQNTQQKTKKNTAVGGKKKIKAKQ